MCGSPRHTKRNGQGFPDDVVQRKEMVASFDVITRDLIIITATYKEGGSQRSEGSDQLEIWSLTESSKRTTLNLPFNAYKHGLHITQNYGPYISDENNPHLGLYVYDLTAERIVVLNLTSGFISMLVVISVSEILKIMASFSHPPRELNWPAWGPRSTRWFNGRVSEDFYVYKSMVFFPSHNFGSLSFGTGTILSEDTNEKHTMIFDFNQRAIRRHRSNPEQIDMKGRNTLNHDTSLDLSLFGTLTKTSVHLFEQEWTIHPYPSIDVNSRLPFGIITGDTIPGEELKERFFLVSDVSIIFLYYLHYNVSTRIYSL